MGASICCAEAEADTQFTIFDLSALKKQCLIFNKRRSTMPMNPEKGEQYEKSRYFNFSDS